MFCSQNEGTFWCCASRKDVNAVWKSPRFALSTALPKWARGDDELSFLGHSICSDFMTWCSLSICGWTPTNGKVMRDCGIPLQVVTVHQFHLLMFTKLDLKRRSEKNWSWTPLFEHLGPIFLSQIKLTASCIAALKWFSAACRSLAPPSRNTYDAKAWKPRRSIDSKPELNAQGKCGFVTSRVVVEWSSQVKKSCVEWDDEGQTYKIFETTTIVTQLFLYTQEMTIW